MKRTKGPPISCPLPNPALYQKRYPSGNSIRLLNGRIGFGAQHANKSIIEYRPGHERLFSHWGSQLVSIHRLNATESPIRPDLIWVVTVLCTAITVLIAHLEITITLLIEIVLLFALLKGGEANDPIMYSDGGLGCCVSWRGSRKWLGRWQSNKLHIRKAYMWPGGVEFLGGF